MHDRASAARVLLVGASLLFLPAAAASQGAVTARDEHEARPVVHAVRTDATIHVDGRLDEAAWAAAPVYSDFTQIDPEEGQPASQRMEVRVLYDDGALYVGARMFDDGEIIGRLGRRDMPLGDSDWLGVMLDSYHDHRTAFGFDVNPAGVRRDELKVIEADDNSWDPVWDVATTVDDEGWTAEYRIPFSQLRFSSADVQTWGIQLERVIGRRREYSVSTFIPKSEQGGVPKYGHLEGLRDIEPGRRLELLPYGVAKGEYVDPGLNPYRTDSEQAFSAGLDLKFRPTSNLTLDATINPDFGQVEVDPAVINLGVYETFFEEKRPFFIEGSEIFDFGSGQGGQLFYTRRIGRAPQVSPPSPLADVPTATTILGATKLSGRTAGGWSVGAMEALTQRETARYLDGAGLDQEMTAEPFTNYFVGRARKDLRGGATAIGGLFTATNRAMDSGSPASQVLRSGAYAAGVDFRHEWDNRRWALRGAVAVSHVTGSAEAITLTQRLSNHYFQRPDADHLDVDSAATSLTGAVAYLSLERQAGEHWRGSLAAATTTPGYEVNDLGYNYRTDRRDIEGALTYQENRPGSFLRSWYLTGSTRFEGNWDGQLIADWFNLVGFARHLDFWFLYGRLSHSLRAYDDRLTRGGPMAVRPASTSATLHGSTDARKPVTLSGTLYGTRDEFDGWNAGFDLTVTLKSSTSWNVSLGPTFTRQYVVAQYVTTAANPAAATFGADYVFAPLDYTELGLETRLNLAFTPDLSLEVYLQPLLSNGAYGDPKYLAAPSTYDFAPFAGAAPDRDFNLRSLRGNAVLRWEWRRGSTLYLAWQQSRQSYDPFDDFDFGRDRRALFNAQPDNIFVIKASYWLNP